MGCNFADIDNDGFLDIYLGTGRMALEILVPNLMFKNKSGKRFEDATMSSGTGRLQKEHGISFADWDCDGDLDLFVKAGGGVPGNKAYNVLFQNPGHPRNGTACVSTRRRWRGAMNLSVSRSGSRFTARPRHARLESRESATALRCHSRAAGYDVAPFRPLEAEFWLAGRATHLFRERGSL